MSMIVLLLVIDCICLNFSDDEFDDDDVKEADNDNEDGGGE